MANHPNDDLFESTKMSFGDHIEELRHVLFRSLWGLAIGFLIGLFIAKHVVIQIETPLTTALTTYYQEKARDELKERYSGEIPVEQLNLMLESNLAPDYVSVDPYGFIDNLRSRYPAQFASLHLKPHAFTADDFYPGMAHDWCAAIKKASAESADSTGKAIWKNLSQGQQKKLTAWAALSSLSAEQQQELVGVLNDVIDKPALHDSAAFANAPGANQDAKSDIKSIRKKLAAGADVNQTRRLNRLLISAAFDYYLKPPKILIVEMPTWKPTKSRVQALSVQEPFMIFIKAAFFSGLLIASPWIFIQIWSFVAAGLYPHEQRYVWTYLPFSLMLFLAGASLAFFFVFKPVLDFLFRFNKMMNIDPDPRIGEWLGFVLFMPIGFGVSFQLPLVMLFLERIGIFTVEAYLEKWRIAVLVIFVISMLLTPADPISMLLMAVPLTILYFSGVGLCKWMPRGRNPFGDPDKVYEP